MNNNTSWESIPNDSPLASPDYHYKNIYKLEDVADHENEADKVNARYHLSVECRTNSDNLEVGFDANRKIVLSFKPPPNAQGATGNSETAAPPGRKIVRARRRRFGRNAPSQGIFQMPTPPTSLALTQHGAELPRPHTSIELLRHGHHIRGASTFNYYVRADYREYNTGWHEVRSHKFSGSDRFLQRWSLDEVTSGSANTDFEAADYKVVKR